MSDPGRPTDPLIAEIRKEMEMNSETPDSEIPAWCHRIIRQRDQLRKELDDLRQTIHYLERN